MKRTQFLYRLAHVTLLVLLVAAACTPSRAQPDTSIDTQQIVETVTAQVALEWAQRKEIVPALYEADPIAATDQDAESLEQTLIRLYQRANPSVVYIIVSSGASGSGFVYNQEGYIVTNHHVATAGPSYEVVFAGGERLRAKLVGADADSDLAVIKVDALPEGLEPLPLADPDSIQVGQLVAAIGNPFGEQGSMSLGIVSGVDRSLRSQRASMSGSSYTLPQVIQTDAPINPGNSGGPLLNMDGQVIGVNAAIASTTGANAGVGFSIPVAAVRQIVPSLIEDGEYVYPYIGASFDNTISLDEQARYGVSQTRGAYVVGVTPGSSADEAGLIAADPQTGRGGDLIVDIDDYPIDDFSDLNSYLVFHARAGQTIAVTVLRDGEHVLQLTLGARP